MKKFEIVGHEPSFLPDGYDWKLAWHDEFDGDELDRTKWDYRLSLMGKRWGSYSDKGVTLDGKGNAVFKPILEDGKVVCSQIQTGYNFMDEPVDYDTNYRDDALKWRIGPIKKSLFTHKYGYYECRCRLQQLPGWWSAFWIQSPNIGSTLDPAESGTEIDVMESFKPGIIHTHAVYTSGYGVNCQREENGGYSKVDKTVFHRFGLLWDETGYTFYIDGVVDGRITNYVSHRPEFILLSAEINGYRRNGVHDPEAEKLPGNDEFIVDYVRVFDVV